jgi:very-short-patch-repair endonuclease
VLVEVDGMQHTDAAHHSTDAHEQWRTDRMKETAAVRRGFHVARLHMMDMVCWASVVSRALGAARSGIPACVHYSSYYLQPLTMQL